MTKQETEKVAVGDTVWRVDCFGDSWAARVIEGSKGCLMSYEKEVGIEYINEHPTGFARTPEEKRALIREAKADYGAAMFGW